MQSIVLVLALTVAGVLASSEHELAQHLRDNYPDPKFVRPVEDHTQVMDLNVAFMLTKIHGFDRKSGTLDVSGWVIRNWIDPNLSWDPAAYADVEKLAYDASLIWTSHFGGYAEHKEVYEPKLAYVHNSGNVGHFMYARYLINCEHNNQTGFKDCNIDFGTYAFDVNDINVRIANPPGAPENVAVKLVNFQENPSWRLESSTGDIVREKFGPMMHQVLRVTLSVSHQMQGEHMGH